MNPSFFPKITHYRFLMVNGPHFENFFKKLENLPLQRTLEEPFSHYLSIISISNPCNLWPFEETLITLLWGQTSHLQS